MMLKKTEYCHPNFGWRCYKGDMLSLSHRLKTGQVGIPCRNYFAATDGEEGRSIRLSKVISSDKRSRICSERDNSLHVGERKRGSSPTEDIPIYFFTFAPLIPKKVS